MKDSVPEVTRRIGTYILDRTVQIEEKMPGGGQLIRHMSGEVGKSTAMPAAPVEVCQACKRVPPGVHEIRGFPVCDDCYADLETD